MQINESIEAFLGQINVIHIGSDGKLKNSFTKHNLIVQSGFDFICMAIGDTANRPATMQYIAVGSGGDKNVADGSADAGAGVKVPLESNMTLGTEIGRKIANYSHVMGTKVLTYSTTFTPGEATGAITEAGVFNAMSAGVMLDRVIFPVINKLDTDTVIMQFQFTLK